MSDRVAPDPMPVAPPLVEPEWLAERLGDPGLLILDIRSVVDGGARAAYEASHIPGAIHTDYAKDGWRATRGMATGLLPDSASLAALFGRVGLLPHHHAIIVAAGTSAGDFSAAARVYWTLKVAGHERKSILNGGMIAWCGDPSRKLEAGPGRTLAAAPDYPINLAGELRAEVDCRRVCDRQGRRRPARQPCRRLLRGAGKVSASHAGGPAPGRRSSSTTRRLSNSHAKMLRPRAELERLFAAIPARPVINYCNTGHQAATNWFILSELLGRPDVSLYDGSLSEWTQEPGRPVAVGAAEATPEI